MMRFYGAIQKVEPLDDGTVRVHGIATSEVVDDQGETVLADAMRAALPDYMRFPALREMHQLSAAGTTLEAEVGDDGMTRIVAHVVDPIAVAKVKSQVYRGFSIGGRVTKREPGHPKVITGLVLGEISLVDRPANPEAVFDCWKAAVISDGLRREAESDCAPPVLAQHSPAPFNPPTQIWACGVPGHHHRAKNDAVKCLETQSLEADASGTASSEAAPEVSPEKGEEAGGEDATADIESNGASGGSPREGEATLTEWNAGRAARMIQELDGLRHALEVETAMAGGASIELAQWQANIVELSGLLNTLMGDETGGMIRGDARTDGGDPPDAPELLARVVGTPSAVHIGDPQPPGSQNMQKLTTPVHIKAARSQSDQALLDMALYACDSCLKIDGMTNGEGDYMGSARDHLVEAGAAVMAAAGDMAGDPMHGVPRIDNADDDALKASRFVAKADGNRSPEHRNLMDVAHECVSKLIDGVASRPAEAMEHLRSSHQELTAAGARCNCGVENADEEQNEIGFVESNKASPTADLAKVLADERAEKAALVRTLGEMLPMLDRLSKRVDDIASTPLPPLTMAKGNISVSKQQDSGGRADLQLSPEAVAAALAKMSKEDQTLTLIKASYANPIRVQGTSPADPD